MSFHSVIGTTGYEHDFKIQNHTGNKVRYTWDFDDGNINMTTDMNYTHIFQQAGVYTVRLVAENDVSMETFVVGFHIVIHNDASYVVLHVDLYTHEELTDIDSIQFGCFLGGGNYTG